MTTKRYALNTDYTNGATLYTGEEIARVHRILDSQLGGALEALGVGIIDDPDATSLQVTANSGLAVTVAPGRALVRHSTLGGCFLELDTSIPLNDLEPNETLYLFAALDVTTDNDSRETALPILLIQETDTCDGGILLAELVTNSSSVTVSDRRVGFSLSRIAQIESDLGYNNAERAKGSVADRLNALLGTDGDDAIIIKYLSQLKYSEADPRNAVVVLEEKINNILVAALDAVAAGGNQQSTLETDRLWSWVIAFRNTLGIHAPNLLRLAEGAGAQPGLHGTDSAPTTEQFDKGGTLEDVPSEREYDSR